MKINGWRYYNHAAVPTTLPHETPNMSPIEDGSIWKLDGSPLLARWTTDFDCGYETNWWYVIKDTPFDISALKAKRRYEINKGVKNFEVVKINPTEYGEELLRVQIAAFSAYPPKYRPSVDMKAFLKGLLEWKEDVVMGAFCRETGELCGYAKLRKRNNLIDFKVLKTDPKHERNGVNAALVESIMREFNSALSKDCYICDGARSINHETAFQDYLEKYFGFRKAYCKLNVTYSPKFKCIVNLSYPFRKLLAKADGIGAVHSLNSILRMEEICRNEATK